MGLGTTEGKEKRLPSAAQCDHDLDIFLEETFSRYRLRSYQLEPARAIVRSVRRNEGFQFGVVFSRQSGKDELLSQVLAYLLWTYKDEGGSIVVTAPSFKPQAATMAERLLDRLSEAELPGVKSKQGYVVTCNRANVRFLSASPRASTRGQTASLLLVANEAQNIDTATWDAVFDPMAATTNATTLFMGTVWTQETLLARQMRYFEERERRDGVKRLWKVDWKTVATILPAYGDRVRERIEQLGIDHPYVKTEYMLEELDGAGGLFGPQRLAMLQGDHKRRFSADPFRRYALLIDVAGEDETVMRPGVFDPEARRDATAVTVVDIGAKDRRWRGGLSDGDLPVYRVVDRIAWTGERHSDLHERLVHLARETWKASAVVIDSTGVGAGLASFLAGTLERRSGRWPPIQVVPFQFTRPSKSKLGWDFTALIDHGRFKEYRETARPGSDEALVTDVYWSQLRSIHYEIADGPGKAMTWAAKHGHDDLVLSAALVSKLEDLKLQPRQARGHVEGG